MSGTEDLRSALAEALPDRPFTVALWDGSRGRVDRRRRADVPDHIADGARPRAAGAVAARRRPRVRERRDRRRRHRRARWRCWRAGRRRRSTRARSAGSRSRRVRAGALRGVPRVPEMELRPKGRRHSILRDKRAVTHHYSLSNEYFALFLDESMTYSCAIWSRGATTLEEAQRTSSSWCARSSALQPGERVLDVGCGWGSFAHPRGARARRARHRDHALGAAGGAGARAGARRPGGRPRRHPRHGLPRAGGRAVRRDRLDRHGRARRQREHRRVLREARVAGATGGRIFNHGIARLRVGDAEAGPFSERYVFPDAAPLHLSRIQTAVERAGLHTRHVEDFPEDYARTLLEWQRRFEANIDRARELGRRRARARVADLPARLAPGVRERLHVGLPPPRGQAVASRGRYVLYAGPLLTYGVRVASGCP